MNIWTGRVEIREDKITGSIQSMYGYILTYSRFKGRTFKLCFLNRWDFNFCIHSSPLRGTGRVEISKEEIPGSKRSTYGYILTYSRL